MNIEERAAQAAAWRATGQCNCCLLYTSVSQTEDFVCKALEHYNKFLRNRAERDSI